MAGLVARDPRRPTAVSEADDQFHAHRHAAALADDQTHEMRRGPLAAQGHEVDQDDRTAAVGGGEFGFENERVAPIPARAPHVRLRTCGWRDPPMAVVRTPQQRRKTCLRVEAGPAQPVDGAVLGDERGRLAVTDQRIVLDAARHDGQTSRGRRPRCRWSHARALRPCPLARPGTIPPFVQLNSCKGPDASASWTQLIMLDTMGQIAEPYGSIPSYVLMVGATGIEPVTPTMSR